MGRIVLPEGVMEVHRGPSHLEAGMEGCIDLGAVAMDLMARVGGTGLEPGDLLALGHRAVVQVMGGEGDDSGESARGGGDPGSPLAIRVRVILGGAFAPGDSVSHLRPSRDLAVVVLAGGRSTRFGRDKRWADAGDGRPLLNRAVDVARQVTGEVVISVGAHEPSIQVSGATTVADEIPDAGPLGGLVASLRACGASQVLAFAVDQPGVTADLLRVLAVRREGPSLCLRCGEDLHPLPCALDRLAMLPVLESFLVAGRRALHQALQAGGLKSLDVALLADLGPGKGLLLNVNAPGDLVVGPGPCPRCEGSSDRFRTD